MITFITLVLASFLGGILALVGAVALLVLLIKVEIEDEVVEKYRAKQTLS